MDNLIKIEKCPICNSYKNKIVLATTDYLVSKDKFDIYECKYCSFRFTSPVPNKSEISKYYDSDEYISHSEKSTSIIDRIYKIVQKITLKSKKKIIDKLFFGVNGSLLDIGCGTGDFLQKMKSTGWKVTGVEINATARKIAEDKISESVFTPLEFVNSDFKYDVITMWHSLEHLHDLKDYVQKIVNTLNKDGLLFIAVPNYQSFDAEYYKENWAAYDVPRHLYHFSFRSAEELFNEFGFKIINNKQLPFDSFYVSLLSELKVIGSKNILKALR